MSRKSPVGPDRASAKRRCALESDDDDDDHDDHGLTMDCPEDPVERTGPPGSVPASTSRGLGRHADPSAPSALPPPPPPPPPQAAPPLPSALPVDRAAIVASWGRPPAALAAVLAAPGRPLSVQVVDVDFYTDLANEAHGTRAVVRLFGVTRDGVSVLMHVPDFRPYFYVQLTGDHPPLHDSESVGGALARTLNGHLAKTAHAWDYVDHSVLSVRPCTRRSIRNYSVATTTESFWKVELALPSLMAPCRQLFEDGIALQLERGHGAGAFTAQLQFDTFESNCAFPLRFMVDLAIVGCGWVSAASSRWTPRTPSSCQSRCQLEVDLSYHDLVAHPTTSPEWMAIAPMRLLSFDIECMGRAGIFPEAEHDPVIQIANYVQLQGVAAPVVAVIFTLDTCSPTGCGAQVISYAREADLLRAWACFVRHTDPDLLTGYNIVNFDLPYLLDRAHALGVADFPYLGRVCATKTRAKEKVFQSKQTGARKSKEINVEGCVVFDAFVIFQRDERLSSLSLNFVSSHFLGDQKEDVPHTAITGLQRGDADTRRRLAVYCLKDAWLPLRLLDKRMKVVNYVEMARVTGVPLSYLLTRGQQIKVMSMLYRKCRPLGLVLPVARDRDRVEGAKYEGATVIEPVKGFYRDHPIATLCAAS